MKVILDPRAGICGGVRRAIRLAEQELAGGKRNIFVLGDIIHNEREVERLDRAGLKTIHDGELDTLPELLEQSGASQLKVLVRAHGEPPEKFAKLAGLGVEIIDGTCPVVTRSQDLARRYRQLGFQVVIVGKHNHPETIGIVGHTGGRAKVVQFDADIQQLVVGVPTMVMAQTTISPRVFAGMAEKIRACVGTVEIKDTMCRFVVRREQKLPSFARQADVILVVGGHKSSNTIMLAAACRAINPRSYHIVSVDEIDLKWFEDAKVIGVTGSASTPHWLLQEFVDTLEQWVAKGRIGAKSFTSGNTR